MTQMVHLYLPLLLLAFLASSNGELKPEKHSLTGNGSPVSALYIMGDSSVDCGENNPLYPFFHRNFSLVPCTDSKSTLLPYLIAEKMGFSNVAPFYGQNGSIDGIKSGLNYGSAHATIIKPGSLTPQSLSEQLRQVFETFQLLQLQLGDETAQEFIKSSVFYLSFGKDDYTDIFLSNNTSTEMLKKNSQEFAQILADQMVLAIRSLYDANVRKIVCMGILPLGCTPWAAWEWHNVTSVVGEKGCVEEVNELVLQYNIILNEDILELNKEFPDAQIIFCDVYQGIIEIINNPMHYGFEDSRNACCGLGLHGVAIGCLSVEMSCNQPSGYVWWDLYNPSQAVNTFLADSAWSGYALSGICHPMTVQDLVYTPVAYLT